MRRWITPIISVIVGLIIFGFSISTKLSIATNIINNLSVLLIILGLTLLLIGILTNITHRSTPKLGAISRTEVYGVVVALVGYMFYINNRIDTVYQTIITLMNK